MSTPCDDIRIVDGGEFVSVNPTSAERHEQERIPEALTNWIVPLGGLGNRRLRHIHDVQKFMGCWDQGYDFQ